MVEFWDMPSLAGAGDVSNLSLFLQHSAGGVFSVTTNAVGATPGVAAWEYQWNMGANVVVPGSTVGTYNITFNAFDVGSAIVPVFFWASVLNPLVIVAAASYRAVAVSAMLTGSAATVTMVDNAGALANPASLVADGVTRDRVCVVFMGRRFKQTQAINLGAFGAFMPTFGGVAGM